MYNDSKYVREKSTIRRWKNYLGNQYTLSFETENIEKFLFLQDKLHCIMFRLSDVSQEMIDVLYDDMKSLVTKPARTVSVYKDYKGVTQKSRRHGKKPWFNN